MPEAGWYDDPLVVGQKRYWDGQAWTESIHPPPGRAHGAPPFEPLTPAAYGIGSSAPSGDIGDWLNRSFRMVWANIGPLLLFFIALPGVCVTVMYLAFHLQADRLVWTRGSGIDGFSPGLLLAAGLALLLGLVAAVAGTLAAHHLLYGAHVGRSPSIGQSLAAGLTRLPKAVGIGLLLIVGFYLLMLIPFGLFVVGLAEGTPTGALVALSLLSGLAVTVFTVWMWVKTSFLGVSVAVAPSRTSALKASFGVSRGRFWSIFGRLLVVTVIGYIISFIVQSAGQAGGTALVFSNINLGPSGELLLADGTEVSTLDRLAVSELLPNPLFVLAYLSVFVLGSALSQMLLASGTSALYADAGAPNSFGHRSDSAWGAAS